MNHPRGIGRCGPVLPLVLFTLCALTASSPASAGEAISVRPHVVRTAAGPLRYVSEAGRIEVRDEGGTVRGALFFVGYRVPARRPRPVTFVWNGGPGGNALLLHTEMVGPRRLTAAGFVDNPDTLLAASDLVFLDPQSTGYSRAASDADARDFYSTLSDQRWTARFIAAWRDRFAAHRAPVFLLGESFGVPRATGVAEILLRNGVPLRGIVLVSGGRPAVEEALPPALATALHTPNKAMAAYLHGTLAGPLAGKVREATERWARATYAPWLERAASLTPAERQTAVADIAAHLGVEAKTVDPATLTVTARTFTTTLLAPERLNPYDMRLLLPRWEYDGSTPDPAGIAARARRIAHIRRYFSHELGYRTPLAYWGLEDGQPPVNASWTYAGDAASMQQANDGGGPPENTPWISRALAVSPALGVFVAVGRYDSQNSCEADAELAGRLRGAAASAVSFHCYAGGHMMYRDEPARLALSRDIARFVRARAGGSAGR